MEVILGVLIFSVWLILWYVIISIGWYIRSYKWRQRPVIRQIIPPPPDEITPDHYYFYHRNVWFVWQARRVMLKFLRQANPHADPPMFPLCHQALVFIGSRLVAHGGALEGARADGEGIWVYLISKTDKDGNLHLKRAFRLFKGV